MVLTQLTNDELVRHLRDTPLTEAEAELLDRLTAALDEIDELATEVGEPTRST